MNRVCKQHGRVQCHKGRLGAAAVEFAMTAPILILFLFATLEFSRYNMVGQTATNAAFEGARKCIVPGATASGAQTTALNYLAAAHVSGGSATVNPATITDSTSTVGVTVTVPLSQNLWTSPVFCGSGTLTKSCTLTRDWVNSTRAGQ